MLHWLTCISCRTREQQRRYCLHMKGGGDDDVRVKMQQSFGNIVTVVTAGGEFERRRVTTAIVYCTDSINQQCHMSRDHTGDSLLGMESFYVQGDAGGLKLHFINCDLSCTHVSLLVRKSSSCMYTTFWDFFIPSALVWTGNWFMLENTRNLTYIVRCSMTPIPHFDAYGCPLMQYRLTYSCPESAVDKTLSNHPQCRHVQRGDERNKNAAIICACVSSSEQVLRAPPRPLTFRNGRH